MKELSHSQIITNMSDTNKLNKMLEKAKSKVDTFDLTHEQFAKYVYMMGKIKDESFIDKCIISYLLMKELYNPGKIFVVTEEIGFSWKGTIAKAEFTDKKLADEFMDRADNTFNLYETKVNPKELPNGKIYSICTINKHTKDISVYPESEFGFPKHYYNAIYSPKEAEIYIYYAISNSRSEAKEMAKNAINHVLSNPDKFKYFEQDVVINSKNEKNRPIYNVETGKIIVSENETVPEDADYELIQTRRI